MFRVHFAKLCKNDLKSTISFKALPIFPKELVKFNMQHITAMKCITHPQKKAGKSGCFRKK